MLYHSSDGLRILCTHLARPPSFNTASAAAVRPDSCTPREPLAFASTCFSEVGSRFLRRDSRAQQMEIRRENNRATYVGVSVSKMELLPIDRTQKTANSSRRYLFTMSLPLWQALCLVLGTRRGTLDLVELSFL